MRTIYDHRELLEVSIAGPGVYGVLQCLIGYCHNLIYIYTSI
jgi:hypothetical protein